MRKFLSVSVGLVSLAMGLTQVLASFGILPFTLPFNPPAIILAVLMVIGAILLFADAADEMSDTLQWMSVISGILIVLIGGAYIVGLFVPSIEGLVNGIPFISMIINVLLAVSGIFLLFGAMMST